MTRSVENAGVPRHRNLSKKVTLSHLGADGSPKMVDVSQKPVTARHAEATALIRMQPEVRTALLAGDLPKGEALTVAQTAGIFAAKKTGTLIPLCHPLPLDWVQIRFRPVGSADLLISCEVRTTARTGAEMEALVGASLAALTLYDMAKAADPSITIGPIQLVKKSGGRSGDYVRSPDTLPANRPGAARRRDTLKPKRS